ncbi:putative large terminase subunit [Pseudoalteromonas phage J2-1_QLiu-2017]|nr:putative large terminase subunit [Pseudoalteromonas phage J2-1_QLiu-2017]
MNPLEYNDQGAELTAAVFDEFTHFDEASFNYIRTRMRSDSKYPSFIRCSMNPAYHFVRDKYIDPFIVKDKKDPRFGVIDRELSGKLRWYYFDGGQVISSWSKQELIDEATKEIKPRCYTVVGSSIKDNKAMLAYNPDYEDDLQANDPANAAMLLDGNWYFLPKPNSFWDRANLNIITTEDLPSNITFARGWDKASQEPNKEKSSYDPDYTASIMMGKDDDGNIYMLGNYVLDKEHNQMARFRQRVGPRDETILRQCQNDGDHVYVVLPKDPAQAGQVEFEQASKKLAENGFTVVADPMPSNKSKAKRFEPFCAATHNGYVYLVEDTFDPKVLEYLYNELENFDGEENNGYKDDMVDATASVYNYLVSKTFFKPVRIPKAKMHSKLHTFRRSVR